MTMTEKQGYKPSRITATQARSRYQDIQDLVNSEDFEEAQLERSQLYLDTLYSIANAPTMADKLELKRLAACALAAFEIHIGGS
jgi:hypothetical protein